jgi:hypothetical protein
LEQDHYRRQKMGTVISFSGRYKLIIRGISAMHASYTLITR